MSTKRAIIIGASTGIGKELAIILAENGYEVGLTARREPLLKELQDQLKTKSYIRQMDVAQLQSARDTLMNLFEEMGDVELIVLNAGIGSKSNSSWEHHQKIIDINVAGFVALGEASMVYFTQRGGGHIVGISSVAGLAGLASASTYSGSKAFISTYMQSLRWQSTAKKLNISVTDVRPGFVATPLTEGKKGMFWVANVHKACRQIFSAIQRRKRIVYITRRWRLAGWLMQVAPDWLLIRL